MPKATRYDDNTLSSLLEDLWQRHRKRDAALHIRNALIHRRREADDKDIGTFIPPPYDKSALIIRHRTGILAQTAQRWTAQLSANAPRTIVKPVTDGDREPSARQQREATVQEHLHNGIWLLGNGRSMQRQTCWSSVVEGTGWYFCYERDAGFGLPERRYFDPDEVTDEEALAGEKDGMMLSHYRARRPDGSYAWAEHPDLYVARAREKMREDALNARTLFVIEAQPDSQVYAEKDRLGWKIAVIMEHIPAGEYGENTDMAKVAADYKGDANIIKKGLILDANKRIAGGISIGGATPSNPGGSKDTWVQCRVWTRDEVYIYVCKSQSFRGGQIVWSSKHDYGEVPAYPVPFTETGKPAPEERHMPALEAGFSTLPAYNQILTLLSQAATFNTIPRWVIEKPDGSGPMIDPRTQAPKILDSDSTIGLDPTEMQVIQAGGQIKQLKVENFEDLIKTMAILQTNLADALPSKAAQGTGGTSGPAHTTNLLQGAQRELLAPAVENHADAIRKMHHMIGRVIRKRGMPVYLLAAPGKRMQAGNKALVELKPDRVSMNISVTQSPNSREEQITLLQMGMNLLNNAGGTPLIDEIEFHEEYKGSNDPEEAMMRSYLQLAFMVMAGTRQVDPNGLIQQCLDLAAGLLPQRLQDELPQVARALAAQNVADRAETAGGGALTRAAGIAEPGVNAPLTLEGTGTAPGGLPSQQAGATNGALQGQNSPGRGAPNLP